MPASTFQDTFNLTSLTAPGVVILTPQPAVGASSNAVTPPTVGQLWPRITQT